MGQKSPKSISNAFVQSIQACENGSKNLVLLSIDPRLSFWQGEGLSYVTPLWQTIDSSGSTLSTVMILQNETPLFQAILQNL